MGILLYKVLSGSSVSNFVFIPKVKSLEVEAVVSRQDKEWERMLNAEHARKGYARQEWADAKTRLERWEKAGKGMFVLARKRAVNILIDAHKRGLKEINLRSTGLDCIPPLDLVWSTKPDILIEDNELSAREKLECYELQQEEGYHGCKIFLF